MSATNEKSTVNEKLAGLLQPLLNKQLQEFEAQLNKVLAEIKASNVKAVEMNQEILMSIGKLETLISTVCAGGVAPAKKTASAAKQTASAAKKSAATTAKQTASAQKSAAADTAEDSKIDQTDGVEDEDVLPSKPAAKKSAAARQTASAAKKSAATTAKQTAAATKRIINASQYFMMKYKTDEEFRARYLTDELLDKLSENEDLQEKPEAERLSAEAKIVWDELKNDDSFKKQIQAEFKSAKANNFAEPQAQQNVEENTP